MVSLKQLIIVLAQNIDPRPYLAEVERLYGKTAMYIVMTVIIGLGVILFGFSFDSVIHWIQ